MRVTKTRAIAASGALIATLAGVGLSAAPASALYNQKNAAVGEFPFFVDVGGWCGGVLIDPEWVLTAGDCAATDGTLGQPMRVGYVNAANPGTTTIARERFRSSEANIALIRVDPVTNVKPISIQVPQLVNGDEVTAVAKGRGSNGVLGSARFRVTDEPGDRNTNKNQMNFSIVGVDPASTLCYGDAGSPIISTTDAGPRLTGIAFAVTGSCGEPGTAFNVSPQTSIVADWIEDTITRPVGEFALRNKKTGKYLDVNAQGEIVQRAALSAASQVWSVAPSTAPNPLELPNAVFIKNSASGELLGIVGGGLHDGAVAVQFPKANVADQVWIPLRREDGSYKLLNSNSGKVLGIPAGSDAENEKAVQWRDDGAADQKWILERVDR